MFREREGTIIKKEEPSSSSDSLTDSESDSETDSDSEMEEKPSSTKRFKRRSSCKSNSSSGSKIDILNEIPIEIDSDPILIQSSDEETNEQNKLKQEEMERVREYQGKNRNIIKIYI